MSLILGRVPNVRQGPAEKIRQAALNAPIGPNGRTIAQAMVALGMAGPKGSDAV